ncbi:MAG: hypothetical protein LBC61_06175 [Candidatus Peribacteria bacterium]|nr:hypothetical protein [Candidatus Peribacteria bacterium]
MSHELFKLIVTSHLTYFTQFTILSLFIFLVRVYAFCLIFALVSDLDKSEKFFSNPADWFTQLH